VLGNSGEVRVVLHPDVASLSGEKVPQVGMQVITSPAADDVADGNISALIHNSRSAGRNCPDLVGDDASGAQHGRNRIGDHSESGLAIRAASERCLVFLGHRALDAASRVVASLEGTFKIGDDRAHTVFADFEPHHISPTSAEAVHDRAATGVVRDRAAFLGFLDQALVDQFLECSLDGRP
jgi:hypothetical protein